MLLGLLTSTQGAATERALDSWCGSRRLDGNAKHVLRGAHLKVLELEWAPFAYKDSAAEHKWSGFDIDLFSEVANILGFTFEIHEVSMLTNETYTEFLIRTVATPTPTPNPSPSPSPNPNTCPNPNPN